MIDKGKYASHGAYIKKMNQNFLGKWSKPKMAVIHPQPSTKPRQRPSNEQEQTMKVQSKTFDAKFKFQDPVAIKPLQNDLIQPFLYIEKVRNKNKVDKGKPAKMKPFITSKNVRKNQTVAPSAESKVPSGYSNLFEYETDKKNIANGLFQKLLESDVDNVKDLFNMWNKDARRNLSKDINSKSYFNAS